MMGRAARPRTCGSRPGGWESAWHACHSCACVWLAAALATCAGMAPHRCAAGSRLPATPLLPPLPPLAPADELTGFEHNGVSPIALKTRLPIVMSHKRVVGRGCGGGVVAGRGRVERRLACRSAPVPALPPVERGAAARHVPPGRPHLQSALKQTVAFAASPAAAQDRSSGRLTMVESSADGTGACNYHHNAGSRSCGPTCSSWARARWT